MASPVTCRRVGCSPEPRYFKPRGIPLFRLEESVVTMDEWEAIRLPHRGGASHGEAGAEEDGCGHSWEVPYGGGRQAGCPKCTSVNFHRTDEGRGRGFGRGRGASGRGLCGRR